MLAEHQILIRDTARRFAREVVAPAASSWDEAGRVPREVIRAMGELGLLGMTVSESHGGVGADYVSVALAMEEIAWASAALATIMSGHNTVGCLPIERFGSDEQCERYLPAMARGEMLSCFCLSEPHCGSDAAALTTKAVRDGDDYILDGMKQFVTSGSSADLALIFARTGPDQGSRGISAFLVPTQTPGYTVVRVENKLGQNGSDTCQVALEGVRVPAAQRLGAEGEGYRIALANLEAGRIGIAALGVGVARAALELAVAYAQERQSFGKPIFEHQAVAFRLARMAMDVETARQMVLYAARLRDAGDRCIKEASMAKLHASEVAEHVCSEAIQTLGGYGYLSDYGAERLYRDARVVRIYEGTSDVQCLVIARELARESNGPVSK